MMIIHSDETPKKLILSEKEIELIRTALDMITWETSVFDKPAKALSEKLSKLYNGK